MQGISCAAQQIVRMDIICWIQIERKQKTSSELNMGTTTNTMQAEMRFIKIQKAYIKYLPTESEYLKKKKKIIIKNVHTFRLKFAQDLHTAYVRMLRKSLQRSASMLLARCIRNYISLM